ncbi:MAG: HU family DNA-binding protein [Flavobacterium sp.]|jgi:predicted histone-like DNA-binding protein|uniref:HU family DNA-binding protein n=1 Tax=Flavobacterium sp. TaxID=239 RepID=UPI003BA78186
MSVKFTTVQRRNPQELLAPEKFYASAIGDGEVGIEKLSRMISEQCTVTEADCLAVLASLEKQMVNQLEEGRIVRLGRIGSFQIGVSSLGMDTPEEVTSNSIIKSRVLFRPAQNIKNLLKTLRYHKAA